jgi:hypothetical protein
LFAAVLAMRWPGDSGAIVESVAGARLIQIKGGRGKCALSCGR